VSTQRGLAACCAVLCEEWSATWRLREITAEGLRVARPPFNRVDPPRERIVPWIHDTPDEAAEALMTANLWPEENLFEWLRPWTWTALVSVAAYGPEMLRTLAVLARTIRATPHEASVVRAETLATTDVLDLTPAFQRMAALEMYACRTAAGEDFRWGCKELRWTPEQWK
jgi:hypothetical protein